MRIALAFACLTFAVQLAAGQKCIAPHVGDERRECAQMVVDRSGNVETSELKGTVVNHNGEGIPASVVEVYEDKENGILVATYLTDIDGKFCIKNLKKGKYVLKAGWSRLGFNCTDMKIKITGKTKRTITVPLDIGT